MTLRQVAVLALSATMLASPVAATPAATPTGVPGKHLQKQRDHDVARRAVLRREVLPLPRILTMAGGYQAGDVVEVELKNKSGLLVYDVDVLVPSGTVRELRIDARSGKLIANTAKGD